MEFLTPDGLKYALKDAQHIADVVGDGWSEPAHIVRLARAALQLKHDLDHARAAGEVLLRSRSRKCPYDNQACRDQWDKERKEASNAAVQ